MKSCQLPFGKIEMTNYYKTPTDLIRCRMNQSSTGMKNFPRTVHHNGANCLGYLSSFRRGYVLLGLRKGEELL